eukprot:jgi/Undpi1/11920/HiC_scaffold_4.g01619.m1
MAAGPVTHSVYGMGVTKASPPDFGALSKQTATVDVDRLQTELRALHGRLEMLEVVALAAAEEKEKELDFDKDVGSSGVRIAAGTEGGEEEDEEEKGTPRTVDGASRGEMGLTEEMAGSGLLRTNTAKRKKAAAASLQAEVRGCTERVEALSASMKRREKAQGAKEKSAALSRSVEMKRLQLVIESRVTSDDLQQAVSANTDKIIAVQSSVDSALGDNFRRVQDMVQSQMDSLLQMVQALTQQHLRGGGGSRGLMGSSAGTSNMASAVSLLEEDSDGSNTDPDQAFVKAVTEVVRNLLREEERKNAGVHVKTDVFEALQEDYETFKASMEEKEDRQDVIASSFEETQARLNDAEASILSLTEELSSTDQEAMEVERRKRSELDEVARAASSLASDANGECAATRVLVGESRQEGLAEARKEAEAIAAKAEGRVKAEVQRARGDARKATDNLSSELRRYIKTATDNAETQRYAITQAREASEKAVLGATAAATTASEGGTALQQAEARMGRRLDDAVKKQATSAYEMLERVAAGEAELARAEDELKHLVRANANDIDSLRKGQADLKGSCAQANEDLSTEVQDALRTMVVDQDFLEAGGRSSGGRRGRNDGSRGGGGGGGGSRSNNGGDSERRLSLLGRTLRRQGDEMAQKVVTLQRSGVGIVTVLRRMEAGVQALSTKDLFWKAVDAKLGAHKRAVGDVCLQVEEATVSRRSRITLPKEAQACLAGDMQRVAKLMAVKADYEVMRELAKLEAADQAGQDWDERLEYLRHTMMVRFIRDCGEALDKRAPEVRTNFKGEEIREKFLLKLGDALKVALSKYAPTTPGATLFGKIKLKTKACLACDRPFTPSATGRPGPTPPGGITGAGVEPAGLPEEVR